MFTLAHRAMAGQNEDEFMLTDGERICSTAIGWNFGDGHMHNEQLIEALHNTGSSTRPRANSKAATSKSPTW